MPKIIQLTDCHLVPPGRALFDTDPAVRLRQALRDIARWHANAAWLILTGDLAHKGEVEAYRHLADILAEETVIPWRLMLGNHDDRDAFFEVFPDHPRDPNGFVQSTIDLGEAVLILADTLTEGSHGGRLCAQRLGWLADQLDAAGTRPVHLFLHHHPCKVGMALVDGIMLENADDLAALLRGRSNIRHMYFGHVHRPIAGSWMGIPFSLSYGLNHQAGLNLDGNHFRGRTGPAEYAVALIGADSTVVHFHDFLYAYPEILTPGMGGASPRPAALPAMG